MVTSSRGETQRRGASAIGCLFALLIAAVLLYYGVNVGRIYWRYYKLTDEMETSARFAHGRTDQEITRHLTGVAQDLELPAQAMRFTIRRTQLPPLVSIRTEYRVTFELPFHNRIIILKPHAEVRQ